MHEVREVRGRGWLEHVTQRLYLAGSLAVTIFGGASLVGSYQLSLGEFNAPGPGLWPFLVAILITCTGFLLLITDTPSDYETWSRGTARIAAGLIGLALFNVIFNLFGFLIAASLMLALWLRFLAKESWVTSLALSVGGTVVLYLLFVQVLGVPFPDDVVIGG